MKNLFMVSAALLTSTLALAHGDHKPPPRVAKCESSKCTKEEIMKGADMAIALAKKDGDAKKKSWTVTTPLSVEEKSFSKGPEYVMAFEDKSRPEGEQKLYIFVTFEGAYNGANFSGK
ncbi:MAG: hypothetical protein JNL11_02210 [Bdellovibrionaceae bacterium]|nr:hypothetical protein [Pseudobdellovibrionaceae bacterium]